MADKCAMAHKILHTYGLKGLYRVDGDGTLHPILSYDKYRVSRFSDDNIVNFADRATRSAPALLVDVFGATFEDAVKAKDTPQSLADMVRDTAGKVCAKVDNRLGPASMTMLNRQCPKQAVGVCALAVVAVAVDLAASKGGASWLNLTRGQARNVACVLAVRVATIFRALFDATERAQFGANPADVLMNVEPAVLSAIIRLCVERELPAVFVSDDDLDEAMCAAVVLAGDMYKTLGRAGCETLKWSFDAAAASLRVVLGTSTERIESRMRPQSREVFLELASAAPAELWAVTIIAMFRGLGGANLSSVFEDTAARLHGDPDDGGCSTTMGSREQTVLHSLRKTLAAKTPEEGEASRQKLRETLAAGGCDKWRASMAAGGRDKWIASMAARSTVQREASLEKLRKTLAARPTEQREAIREKQRKTRAARPTEQREATREKHRKTWADRPTEQREAIREKKRKTWAARPTEQREATREKLRKTLADRPTEQREATREKLRKTLADRPTEEREATREKKRIAAKQREAERCNLPTYTSMDEVRVLPFFSCHCRLLVVTDTLFTGGRHRTQGFRRNALAPRDHLWFPARLRRLCWPSNHFQASASEDATRHRQSEGRHRPRRRRGDARRGKRLSKERLRACRGRQVGAHGRHDAPGAPL